MSQSMRDVTAAADSITTSEASRPTQLIVVGGADSGPQVRRLEASLTIGRDEACDIVLADATASRVHARVTRRDDGALTLVDLGSRNGVFLNGEPVGEAGCTPRAGQAVVRLGDSLLCLTTLESVSLENRGEGPLVGGASLATVRRQISLIAPTDLPVLVRGETGTGKEVAARMLHQASGRSGPFVPVNCAALPAQLIESELFGHVKGAFTGATQNRKGLFSLADGGTLFLDEVGELPLELQAKLLRVLQEKKVRAVGAEREQSVNVRIVSATHRPLHGSELFRPDLLARLAGVEIRLPSLRERPEDILLLANFLLERSELKTQRSELGAQGEFRAQGNARSIDSNALEAMMVYQWPLNVRELDNALRYAALRANEREAGDTINLGDLPDALQSALREARTRRCATSLEHGNRTQERPAFVPNPRQSVSHPLSHETHGETARDPSQGSASPDARSGEQARSTIPASPIDASALKGALTKTRGNVRKAAQTIGLSRAHMYRLLKQYEVDPAAFRKPLATKSSVSSQGGTDVA